MMKPNIQSSIIPKLIILPNSSELNTAHMYSNLEEDRKKMKNGPKSH